jgi:glycerol-3-phosphate dehydrogenase
LRHLPDLSNNHLTGGVLYFDGQFDDSRLAINLAQTAIEQGATVINYFGVTDFNKKNGKITGVNATNQLSGKSYEFNARVVVNATGVFADELLQLAEGHSEKTIAPSQGIHLVLEHHFFRGNTAMMIPKTDDGRVLFVIPWLGKLLLGTTDTPVENVTTEPTALREEIDFIINHFNRYSTSKITTADVKSIFVGLRPLANQGKEKKTAVMPRDHVVKVLPSGLIHVTGGKWTTYRSMAEYAIDKAIQSAGLKKESCKTKNLKIHGWTKNTSITSMGMYGVDEEEIQLMINADPAFSEKIHPNYSYTKAELLWFVANEMAFTIEDILARRTRLLFLDAKAAMEAAPMVAKTLAFFNGKDAVWEKQELDKFNDLAKNYLIN